MSGVAQRSDAERLLRVAAEELTRLRERFEGLVSSASPSARMANERTIESVSALIEEAQLRLRHMQGASGRVRLLAYRHVRDSLQDLREALAALDAAQDSTP